VSLYDRSVDLQLKLEAAQSADTGLELLARGSRLVESLDRASEYFSGAATFRSTANIVDRPGIDLKAVSQAVGAFRAGLSRHGSAAFQHQPATTLSDVARTQRERTTRWVTARWRDRFAEYQPLLDRVETEHLVGSTHHIVIARTRASKLRTVRAMDPVAEASELQASLGGADVGAWLLAVTTLANEMRTALEALDAERAALTPEVRDALQRAASHDGLPLSEVTDELLAALRSAGVDDSLVVRRP
jgi:hypothetical protein